MIFMMYVQTVCSCARASMPLSAGSQGSTGDPWAIHDPSPPHRLLIQGFLKCINIKNVHGMNRFKS